MDAKTFLRASNTLLFLAAGLLWFRHVGVIIFALLSGFVFWGQKKLLLAQSEEKPKIMMRPLRIAIRGLTVSLFISLFTDDISVMKDYFWGTTIINYGLAILYLVIGYVLVIYYKALPEIVRTLKEDCIAAKDWIKYDSRAWAHKKYWDARISYACWLQSWHNRIYGFNESHQHLNEINFG